MPEKDGKSKLINKMKTVRSITMALALFFISGHIMAQVDKKALNVDDSKIALQGYSPVSYLDLGLAQRGNKDFKSEHKGAVYYFTSSEQKKRFDKDPEKYLPQYGGFCAFGIYAGAKFRVDPNKFIVSNGRLYLFLNDIEVDAKQLWQAENEYALIKKADTNWRKLSKAE